jgi:hypothetical protein
MVSEEKLCRFLGTEEVDDIFHFLMRFKRINGVI